MSGDSYSSIDIYRDIQGIKRKYPGRAEQIIMKEDLPFFLKDDKTKNSKSNKCQQRESRRM
jgi:hypothetical protein